MKLYLASYRVPTPKDLFDLVGQKPTETKIALIPNAKDYYADLARQFKIDAVVKYFLELGAKVDVVDLRDYSDAESIREKLIEYQLIWAMGGNTFILRHEMQRSGFDKTANSLLEKGIVYGGESAGALVAGNTIKGIEYADEPEFAENVIWEGLNLTPHFILPHVDNIDFGDAIVKAKEEHRNDPTMVLLNDNQAFIVDGSKEQTVTAKTKQLLR